MVVSHKIGTPFSEFQDQMHRFARRLAVTIILTTAFHPAAARAERFDVPEPFTVTSDTPIVPNVTLRNIDDQTLELRALRGHFVLLSFWATWCGPCIEEMPSLNSLQDDLGDSTFQVLPVSVEGRFRLAKIDWFMRTYNLRKLSVYALDQKDDQRRFNIHAIPQTILIDPQGRELWRALGPVDWNNEAARAMIKHYLNAAP